MASHGCVGIIAMILYKYVSLCFSEGGVDPASHGAGMEDRFYNNKSFQVGPPLKHFPEICIFFKKYAGFVSKFS